MMYGGKRGKKGFSLFSRIYSPVNEALKATENTAQNVGSGVGSIARRGLKLVRNTGSRVASAANRSVRSLTRRRQSGGAGMGTCNGGCA